MAPPPKSKFGQAEEKNQLATLLTWGFVVLGIAGILWMIATNPREKKLTCDSNVTPSLIGFGTCTTE